MSTTDGESPGRLNAALENLFAAAPTLPERDPDAAAPAPNRRDEVSAPPASRPAAAVDDWSVDDADDEPYTLPEIVPATTVFDDRLTTETPVAAAPPLPTAPPLQVPPVTAWGDHMSTVPAGAQGAQLRAPGRRPRVRRVTRVLRHVDPWSTFKVALLFSAVAYLMSLTSGVLLWRVADSTGTLANIERWFTQFGWETFELKGGEVFHNAWIMGLFGAVAMTGGLVLVATLFNLVSDIVGGVRMTVLEEEVVERTVSSARRYVVRRAPIATSDAHGRDDWEIDDEAGAETTDVIDSIGSTETAVTETAVTETAVTETAVTEQAAVPGSRSADRVSPHRVEDWSIDDDDDEFVDDPVGANAGDGRRIDEPG